ncbi:MAG: Hpt domain-containing protein, partial [Algicola sp.]|nr:Hpt domain-containing protein [Algicola sp.]
AHAIKGSAPMYGFAELGSIADKLEIAVNNNDRDNIQSLAESLIAQMNDIVAGA